MPFASDTAPMRDRATFLSVVNAPPTKSWSPPTARAYTVELALAAQPESVAPVARFAAGHTEPVVPVDGGERPAHVEPGAVGGEGAHRPVRVARKVARSAPVVASKAARLARATELVPVGLVAVVNNPPT